MLKKIAQLSQRTRLIISGTVAVLIFILILAPATLVISALPGASIGASGVSGSLWNGSAQRISINGFSVNATRWTIKPLALLAGALELRLLTSWPGGEFEGDLSARITGLLQIKDASVFASLNELSETVGMPASGQLSLNIESLAIKNNWPTQVVGSLNLSGLTTVQPGSNIPIILGNYAVVFTNKIVNDDKPIIGTITDNGGPLELSGQVTLTAPNQYLLETKIKPQANAAANLKQALKFIAPTDNRGAHDFKLNGSF
jgi:general secretion pathway protein N